MSDRPRIELTVENTWCPTHLEPFRAEWPKGTVIGMALMFTAFCIVDEVRRYCGMGDEGQLADAHRLNAALAEFGPICCVIPPLTREEVTAAVLSDDTERVHTLKARLERQGGIEP